MNCKKCGRKDMIKTKTRAVCLSCGNNWNI